jgi:tetratricopeptide (TPR) repeat protein
MMVPFLVAALVCGTPAVGAGGQRGSTPDVQGPAVQQPDRRALEPAVAEQLGLLVATVDALAGEGAPADRLAQAHGLLGQALHAYSMAAGAESAYLEAHRLAPADFRWPYLLAYLLQQQNRLEEALAYFARAQAVRRDYPPLVVRLGDLHLARNRVDEARAAYETALALDPSSAAARYGLGQVAMSRRDYQSAVELFTLVLDLVPDANRVHYVLAMAHRGLGQMDPARAHLQRQGPVGVRTADPLVDALADLVRGARLLLVRGRMAFDAGRYREAAEAFKRALAAEPDNLAAVVNLGSALERTGDVEGAIGQFRRALKLDADNRSALFNLGVLSAASDRHEEAVRHLSRLVAFEPADHAARIALGRALARSGRLDEALAAMDSVATSDPGNEDAVLGRADVLTALGRHADALGVLEQSYARDPGQGRTVVRLVRLLVASPQAELRDYGRALRLGRLVYDATGEVGDGVMVTLALAGLGRCGEARQWHSDLIAKAEKVLPSLVGPLQTELERVASSCRSPR